MKFTKMHGLGNDFAIVEETEMTSPSGDIIRAMSCRRRGIGFNQLLLVRRQGGRTEMLTFNADGSEAAFCGNGLRCVARYCLDQLEADTIELWSGGQRYTAARSGDSVEICLPRPRPLLLPETEAHQLPLGELAGAMACEAWSVGNKHLLVAVSSVVDEHLTNATEWRARLPFLSAYNIGFVGEICPGRLQLRILERGVGETWACGSAATAAAAQYFQQHPEEGAVEVSMLGGELRFSTAKPDGDINMLGPAEYVYSGVWLAGSCPAEKGGM